MSRWERRLEQEADDTRDQLERRFAKEGDSGFTNVANLFVAWRAFLIAGAVIAASIAVLLLVTCLLFAILHD